MATENKQTVMELEMAAKPVAFVDGDYFKGMCEIAAAAHTQTPIYVPANVQGIFDSLFHKRIFARKQLENGSWAVGKFAVTDNRYLYVYDRNTGNYTTQKEDNYNRFLELVKELAEKKNFSVFSLTAPAKEKELDTILG